ncbi:MAG: hypothetical protein MK132_14915 [Lentisphaerales bacterium]|nr:hypothetical protein [Lentisphaerales bacterium]
MNIIHLLQHDLQQNSIDKLGYEKADFDHVQEIEEKVKRGIKRDRRQDQEITDIKDMILELYTNQRALMRYMERNLDFDHEAFDEIIEEIH